MRDQSVADDLMQDTFLHLWRRPSAFNPKLGGLRAYLLGIARKKAIEWWRSHRPESAETVAPARAVAEAVAIREAVQQLPADLRTVLWLREVEGYSYDELAETCEFPAVQCGRACTRPGSSLERCGWRGTMTCIEAEPHVSAVCDGEPIPSDAAEHISTCVACRTTLAEFARIGTDLRIAIAMDSETLPQLELPQRRRVLDILGHRVPVPRLALAALIIAIIVATASVSLVRAQQRPLWFQFGYTLDPGGQVSDYRLAKAGFDETGASMAMVNGAMLSTALRIRVESVSYDDVVLRCRAVPGI